MSKYSNAKTLKRDFGKSNIGHFVDVVGNDEELLEVEIKRRNGFIKEYPKNEIYTYNEDGTFYLSPKFVELGFAYYEDKDRGVIVKAPASDWVFVNDNTMTNDVNIFKEKFQKTLDHLNWKFPSIEHDGGFFKDQENMIDYQNIINENDQIISRPEIGELEILDMEHEAILYSVQHNPDINLIGTKGTKNKTKIIYRSSRKLKNIYKLQTPISEYEGMHLGARFVGMNPKDTIHFTTKFNYNMEKRIRTGFSYFGNKFVIDEFFELKDKLDIYLIETVAILKIYCIKYKCKIVEADKNFGYIVMTSEEYNIEFGKLFDLKIYPYSDGYSPDMIKLLEQKIEMPKTKNWKDNANYPKSRMMVKAHKRGGRPIVNTYGKDISKLEEPLVEKCKKAIGIYFKNKKDKSYTGSLYQCGKEIIYTLRSDKNMKITKADYKSCYTNMKIKHLDAIMEWVNSLGDKPIFTKNDIKEIKIITANNIFVDNEGKLRRQETGCNMGSGLSPLLWEIFAEYYHMKSIVDLDMEDIKIYRRVDDILLISTEYQKTKVEKYIYNLKQHSNMDIVWESGVCSRNTIFLGLRMYQITSNSEWETIYTVKTNALWNMSNVRSNTPGWWICSGMFGEITKILAFSTNEKLATKLISYIMDIMRLKGISEGNIKHLVEKAALCKNKIVKGIPYKREEFVLFPKSRRYSKWKKRYLQLIRMPFTRIKRISNMIRVCHRNLNPKKYKYTRNPLDSNVIAEREQLATNASEGIEFNNIKNILFKPNGNENTTDDLQFKESEHKSNLDTINIDIKTKDEGKPVIKEMVKWSDIAKKEFKIISTKKKIKKGYGFQEWALSSKERNWSNKLNEKQKKSKINKKIKKDKSINNSKKKMEATKKLITKKPINKKLNNKNISNVIEDLMEILEIKNENLIKKIEDKNITIKDLETLRDKKLMENQVK